VFLHAKKRWLPAVQRMTFRALPFFRPGLKLSLVRIRLVTVHALGKRQGFFEVTIQVAFRATNPDMHSDQRVLRLRMVEFKARQQFLPARSGVTFFAALFEGTFVRIHMACRASVKLHVLVASGSARLVRLVAFLAGHLYVQAG